MHDKYFERNVIHVQEVRCSEKKNGCRWAGLLGELARHLSQCQFVEEDCPNQCGAKEQRCDLERHDCFVSPATLCLWPL